MKICFAILAHEDEVMLAAQIQNLLSLAPGSQCVVYNGGPNPNFAKGLGVPICPYSQPLSLGRLGAFLIYTMRWLEEIDYDYDVLIGMDSDIVLVKSGFDVFMEKTLKYSDCIGINMGVQTCSNDVPHWYPGQTMWDEWSQWQPFFQTEGFCGTLNVAQAYRREIVEKIVSCTDWNMLEFLLQNTKVFALEEMLCATLAWRVGARITRYPVEAIEYVRIGQDYDKLDIQNASQKQGVFFLHPAPSNFAEALLSIENRCMKRESIRTFRNH